MNERDTEGAFIVCCNAAAVQCIDYLSAAATQRTAPQVTINLTLLQYRNAVVGAETAFQALQPQRS